VNVGRVVGCTNVHNQNTRKGANSPIHRFDGSQGGNIVGDDPRWTTGAQCVNRGLLGSLHAHLFPGCCFSTALLTQSIHSRSTEPAELRESTATQGIYGNLKILTSAIMSYKHAASDPPPQPFVSAVHLDVYLCHLMAFPDNTLVCLYLIFFHFFFLRRFLAL